MISVQSNPFFCDRLIILPALLIIFFLAKQSPSTYITMNLKAFLPLSLLSSVQTLALSEPKMISRIVISNKGFQQKGQNSSKVPLRMGQLTNSNSSKMPTHKSTKVPKSTKSPKSSKSKTKNTSTTTNGASPAAVKSSSASFTRGLKMGSHGMVVAAIVSCWF